MSLQQFSLAGVRRKIKLDLILPILPQNFYSSLNTLFDRAYSTIFEEDL
jgi:hypothetical protein